MLGRRGRSGVRVIGGLAVERIAAVAEPARELKPRRDLLRTAGRGIALVVITVVVVRLLAVGLLGVALLAVSALTVALLRVRLGLRAEADLLGRSRRTYRRRAELARRPLTLMVAARDRCPIDGRAVLLAGDVERARTVRPGRAGLSSAVLRAVIGCAGGLGTALLLAGPELLALAVLARVELAVGTELLACVLALSLRGVS